MNGRFLQRWVAALGLLLALSLAGNAFFWLRGRGDAVPATNETKPYKEEIARVLAPLRYTGLPTLDQEAVRIRVNFKERAWRIENFRHYTEDGRIILTDGFSGICGELSAFTFQTLQPIVKETHDLKFVRVSRSDFFKFPQGGHTAILMIPRDRSAPMWLIDPSFRLYERVSLLIEDYAFYRVFDRHDDIDRRETWVQYPVNTYMPLIIENDYIVEMGVTDVEGKFDRLNHAMVLYIVRKGKYGGHRIFQIVRKDGKQDIIEERDRAIRALGETRFNTLRTRLLSHFEKLTTDA